MRMPVLGLLNFTDESEIRSAADAFDTDYVSRMAQAFDRWGYHRVLIAQSAHSPDGMMVAANVAAQTERLGFMIAHRPGFVAPTLAARMLATLDRMSGGRVAVHIITATNDIETRADGDFLTKDVRYQRSREYVRLLRRMWADPACFNDEGEFYKLEGASSMVLPEAKTIPVYWGGASGLGLEFGGECADVYALAGSSVARVAELVGEVRKFADRHGRSPKFLMSIRAVIAETDEAAWRRADSIVAAIEARTGRGPGLGSGSDASAARRVKEARLARTADDPCLWGGVIEATGGKSHAMALVGSAETLARELRRYQAIGIDEVLLRGFDNETDAEAIGRDLIPLLAD
jgi:alkanesulfonate monooxygenase